MHDNLQELVLGWVIQTQNEEALTYLKKSFFVDPIDKEILEALQSHFAVYKKIPHTKVLMEYASDDPDWKKRVSSLLIPISEEKFIQDKFNAFVKKEEFKQALTKYLPDYQKGRDIYDRFYRDIEKVVNINLGCSDLKGVFLTESNINLSKVQGYPTFLKSLNNMTKAGGFYAPQLIVFLKGPKTFGTGLLLNLAVEYAYSGLRVFYADFENGKEELLVRLQQTVLQLPEEELELPENKKEFKKHLKAINDNGGDVYIRSFMARVDSMKDVEREIDLLAKDEWIPEVIILDYLDIVGTDDNYVHDRRLVIQNNYLRAVALNKKYDAFTFSISKVKQSAYKKDKFSIEDFGEDAEKAYNAHAAFAFVRDEEDMRHHRARISAVVQRKGKSYGTDDCWLEIDENTHSIIEIKPGLY